MTNTVKLMPVVHKYPDTRPTNDGYYMTNLGILGYLKDCDFWGSEIEDEESEEILGVQEWHEIYSIPKKPIEVQIPDGWQLVPKEPTKKQLKELDASRFDYMLYATYLYHAMLDLAPHYRETQEVSDE